MRIDHHAYQRATIVALFGGAIQFVIGIVLLVFGLMQPDSAFQMAAGYVLAGTIVWVGLLVIFHQHKLERLENLEEDELAASRGGESFFENQSEGSRVAVRRLNLMHKWLMPLMSLLLALVLTALALILLRYMNRVSLGATEFFRAGERGWAVAICLSAAVVSFIFSRFVAGMAKQPVWHNLRGGAAYMVGNALVMLAVAVGIIFRFFENEHVIEVVAYAIPVFMALLTLEVLLNLILNLYRPRIPGEVPRPAFDSKVLSLFAAPDSIVRSLNEAVNYQFGFDVTSSWGYQLLLRSFISLVALGVIAMLLLSTMVIVEPNQQAIRLRSGKLIGDVHESGVMWKLPWPIETSEVYNISRVRQLHLTAKVIAQENVPEERRSFLWDGDDSPKTDDDIRPFIVGSTRLETKPAATTKPEGLVVEAKSEEDKTAEFVSEFYSLVDADVVLEYRIRGDKDGLLEYLQFSTDNVQRRQSLTDRERALKLIALGQVSAHLAQLSLDDVLSPGRTQLAAQLKTQVQGAFDAHHAGVDVVAINLPILQPAGASAKNFEEFGISAQARLQRLAQAERNAATTFTYVIGDAGKKDTILALIDAYNQSVATIGRDDPKTIEKRQAVEDELKRGGGQAAQTIAAAENDRWSSLMTRRAQFSRWQGQLASYRAAPELYRQRETMKLYKQFLPLMDKYIIAVDPSRMQVDIDWKKLAPNLNFAGASDVELNRK